MAEEERAINQPTQQFRNCYLGDDEKQCLGDYSIPLPLARFETTDEHRQSESYLADGGV
jgi:hypothetical protein